MIYLETPRLILRSWKESDLLPFQEMNADTEVMRYFPDTLSYEDTERFLANIKTEFNNFGYGLYAVELKATQEFIGFIGFHWATFEENFTPCVEIGWRLTQGAWGNGYATEGAKTCLQYGFQELDLSEVYSFTADINYPSKRVMQKIGMKYVRHFAHPKVDTDSPLQKHVLYRIGKIE
ncbi:GNAT family N-acetyltransferase [Mangrovibacillus cuniculi]|uniref:GNAT family N-acetyltransferase n=1 Tax=Mangrovibacillus cuniculi TaxID=2593652 RepID=A0A7S8HG85_9BACI|nr:GNAT family N-acetyltransferase [Mangrovibacillus cuniculi]QPC47633.1 GNAT family N-acetyltransferase [Mangrovibacillus cuniculi]